MSRNYSSGLRADQAALTRRRIVDAATGAFVENGYTRTTIGDIAGRAGVSVQTIYNAVGSKAALFKHVYDVMLSGDHEPIPMRDRPLMQAVYTATDARECLALYAHTGRVIMSRVQPLLTIVLRQSDGADPDLRAFAETREGEFAIGCSHMAAHLDERFGLRPGLDVEDATSILWTVASAEVADRLVNRRGWSWDRFERWLGETLADALLGPDRHSDRPHSDRPHSDRPQSDRPQSDRPHSDRPRSTR